MVLPLVSLYQHQNATYSRVLEKQKWMDLHHLGTLMRVFSNKNMEQEQQLDVLSLTHIA